MQWGKCLHLYFYWRHQKLGFCHLLQTWFPYLVQICINGREWLACAMDGEGLGYRREANCFPWIENLARAQQLMDQQHRTAWVKLWRRLERDYDGLELHRKDLESAKQRRPIVRALLAFAL